MQVDSPFRLVTSTVDGDVLGVLARAEAEFTPPEVRDVIGAYSTEGVRKSLQRLAEQGIAKERRVGNARVYRLNRNHLGAPAVAMLASLKDTFLARLRDRLGAWPAPAGYAALFGSAARGAMRPDSDIDLLVVRPWSVGPDDATWRNQLESLSRDVLDWTGNDARIMEFGTDELAQAQEAGDSVLAEVEGEGIRLAGPTRYLTRHQSRA